MLSVCLKTWNWILLAVTLLFRSDSFPSWTGWDTPGSIENLQEAVLPPMPPTHHEDLPGLASCCLVPPFLLNAEDPGSSTIVLKRTVWNYVSILVVDPGWSFTFVCVWTRLLDSHLASLWNCSLRLLPCYPLHPLCVLDSPASVQPRHSLIMMNLFLGAMACWLDTSLQIRANLWEIFTEQLTS